MSTNTRADGRFHSHWLNMIYPRLLVARQLLREDGVIFVSIDDNEVTHLRKVMDEVFGEECFLGCFLWKRRQQTDSRNLSNVSVDHEFIVAYERTFALSRFLGNSIDETKYKNPDNDPRGPWASIDLSGLATKDQRPNLHYEIFDPITGRSYAPNPDRGWSKSRSVVEGMIHDGRILFPKKADGRPREKKFLADLRSSTTGFSTWLDSDTVGFNTNGTRELTELIDGRFFDFPKPINLLSELLGQVAIPNDLILDFFAGSGSAAHAVHDLNKRDAGKRKVISVQIPEATDENSEAHKAGFKKISDITIERVKRVIQGYGDNPQPIDAGFKVFTLEKSAFPRADFAPDPEANEAAQLAALKAFIAYKEASLFNTLDPQAVRDEMLLKCGFQLDVQLTPIAEVKANQLYRALDQQTPAREAIVCFDSQLDTTTLVWLGQQIGQRVIVLEAALETTGKWNLHHQLGDGLVVF
jgi:adenine-specific DNA-methyltransferase